MFRSVHDTHLAFARKKARQVYIDQLKVDLISRVNSLNDKLVDPYNDFSVAQDALRNLVSHEIMQDYFVKIVFLIITAHAAQQEFKGIVEASEDLASKVGMKNLGKELIEVEKLNFAITDILGTLTEEMYGIFYRYQNERTFLTAVENFCIQNPYVGLWINSWIGDANWEKDITVPFQQAVEILVHIYRQTKAVAQSLQPTYAEIQPAMDEEMPQFTGEQSKPEQDAGIVAMEDIEALVEMTQQLRI